MYDSELGVILNFQSMVPVNAQGVKQMGSDCSACAFGNCSMKHFQDNVVIFFLLIQRIKKKLIPKPNFISSHVEHHYSLVNIPFSHEDNKGYFTITSALIIRTFLRYSPVTGTFCSFFTSMILIFIFYILYTETPIFIHYAQLLLLYF